MFLSLSAKSGSYSYIALSLLLAGCGGGGGTEQQDNVSVPPSVSPPVTPMVNKLGDPLLPYQWHLHNTGQYAFSDTPPVAGYDLGVGNLHENGITGKGVQVAIVDDGLEIAHENLAANILPDGSHNFLNNSNDPGAGEHGTSVAGVLGAVGWNGKGGRGVAPNVTMRGFNYLEPGIADKWKTTFQRELLGRAPWSRDVDIFNLSYGTSYPELPAKPIAEITLWEDIFRGSLNNKGAVYVKAAGNEFKTVTDNSGKEIADCSQARRYGIGCLSSSIDQQTAYAEVITVGAVNASGKKASYSSAGPSLWVAGLGGEDGRERAYTALPQTTDKYEPAIITTDVTGCDKGYHQKYSVGNALDAGWRQESDPDWKTRYGALNLAAKCQYTARFNGSSAAAPTVAGVAALMLQANPELGVRDIKWIFAKTARRIDPGQAVVTMAGAGSLILEPGWSKNNAGNYFSNWYGFGLVDAAKAVEMAKGFSPLTALLDTTWKKSMDVDLAIPHSSSEVSDDTGSIPIQVQENMTIENVQIRLQTNHTTPAHLRMVLISPSGTKSYLLSPFSGLKQLNSFHAFMASSAFFEESSRGTWRLQMIDADGTSLGKKQFANWSIRILGH